MGLSIVVTSWRRHAEIMELFESVQAIFPESFYEIIVVSSDDPESEKVKWLEVQKNTKVIIPAVRTGPRTHPLSFFMNTGMKASTKEYIFPVNDDMVFAPEFYTTFLKYREYDAVYINTNLASKNSEPRVPVVGTYRTPKGEGNLYLGDFVLAKKEVYEEVGFLDEEIDWYGLGVDLSLKLLFGSKDYSISYVNDLIIYHSVSGDRDGNEHVRSGPIYGKYLEDKWRNFCTLNPGYNYNVVQY